MASPRQRKNQVFDKGIFGVFAVVGIVAIVALKAIEATQILVTLAPVSLILVYALMTVTSRSRFRLRFDQVGDNCYYLGFIFTLVSLGVALHSFSRGTAAAVELIVQDFGIALATTLIGVTLRVLLHQMREDPYDVEEASRHELGTASARVAGQLGGMMRDVATFRSQTQDELKHFAYETRQVADEHRVAIERFKTLSEELGEHVAGLIERVSKIEAPSDLLEQKLLPTAKMWDQIATSTAKIAEQEESRLKDMAVLTETVRTAALQIGRQAESVETIATVAERIAGALDQMTATAEAMAELQRGTVEMAAHIGEALKRLDRLKDADAIVGRIEKLHASMNLRPTLFGIRRVPTPKPPEPDAG